MLITFEQLKAQNNGQSSGQKWSVDGNVTEIADYFGTKNNFPILFKTNSIQRMILTTDGFLGINVSTALAPLHVNGEIIFNNLGGSAEGLVCADPTGKLKRISFTGNNQQVLLGDGTFGTYTDNDWLVVGNNMFAIPTGTVSFGVEEPDANYKVEIGGNTKIHGELSVGNSIRFNGITDQITTTTGTLDFGSTNLTTSGTVQTNNITTTSGTLNLGNTNIVTTGTVNASQVNLSGNTSLDNATINNLTVNQLTTTDRLVVQDYIEVENTLRFTNTDADIIGSASINIQAVNNINLNPDNNTIINSKLGVGTNAPIEMLDVDGNANIRGYLYVQDGVIIGQRMEGEFIEASERINTKEMEVAQLLKAQNIEISESVNILNELKVPIARMNNLSIDGQNSKITSTTGNINFDNENLTTSGDISANIVSANQIVTNNLDITGTTSIAKLNVTNSIDVTNSIKVGENSVWITSLNEGGSSNNNIYSDNGDLKIQCQNTPKRTIINSGNDGNVGIGTPNPEKKLHVKTSELQETPGEFGGTIRVEHEISGVTSSVWDISPTAVTSTPDYLNRLDIIAPNTSATPVLSLVKDGKVGVGTKTPEAKLHVVGDVKINDLSNTSGETRMVTADGSGKLSTSAILINTGGDIEANTITATNTTIPSVFNNLTVTDNLITNSIEIGENSVYISSINVGGSTDNNIYSDLGDLQIQCQGNYNTIMNDNAGMVGIGKVPDVKLDVAGDIKSDNGIYANDGHIQSLFSDYIEVTSIDAIQDINCSSLTVLSDARIYGDLETNNLQVLYDFNTSYISTDDLEVYNSLHVTGDAIFSDIETSNIETNNLTVIEDFNTNYISTVALDVTGDAVFSGYLEATNTYSNNLTVYDDFNTYRNLCEILNVYGDAEIDGNLDVMNTLYCGDNLTVEKDLIVNGSTNISTLSVDNLQISSETILQGNIIFEGNTVFEGLINSNFSVDGTIMATEIIVESIVSYPDYVFQDKYELMPLNELDNYIKENKHLPNVPTEAEVKKDGIELSKMVNILLQKIEELTLYTIEQQKQIDDLKKHIGKE